MFESNWHNENIDLDDMSWQHDQLVLKPLSDQGPFDILNSIRSLQHNESVAESDATFQSFVDQTHPVQFYSEEPEEQPEEEMEEEEEEDIWTSSTDSTKQPQQTTFNTLSWDTKSPHFPSYTQKRLARKHIGTSFLSEAPTTLFEPVIQSRSTRENEKVIYESDLVKSLIQALIGLPSIHFYSNNNTLEFRMRVPSGYRVLGVSSKAMEPVLQEVLAFGSRLKAIEHVATSIKAKPAKYGSTGLAMACCLSELHLNIQQSIHSISEQEKELTILKVHQYVNHLAAVTKRLYTLFYTSSQPTARTQFHVPFGVDLINLLHSEIKQFDLAQEGNHALYRDISLSLLYYISVPYTTMLSQWLGLDQDYSGVVDDPYQEFFITTHHSVQDLLSRYVIRPNAKLPYFLDRDLAVYVLRSGISLQLLKKTKPEHPIFDSTNSAMLIKKFLKNMENEEYMDKLEATCKYIQAYNSGSTPLIEERSAQPQVEEEQQNDTLMNDADEMTLEFLDTNDLNILRGDFTTTLSDLIQQQQQNNFIPTVDTLTHQSLMKPLEMWCPLLNESFMSSFLHQFKLQLHLSLLYNYFLFGNGTFVNGLKETFFKTGVSLSHSGRWPPRSYDLNMALLDLLADTEQEEEGQDLLTFSIRETTESSSWRNPNAVEALDFLQLNYHASYPLNMLITPTILSKYNRLFTFLLQALRACTVTKRLFEPLKKSTWFRTSTRDKLLRYRFELDQFMTALQGYLSDTAIGNTWQRFMQHVNDMHTGTQSDDYVRRVMSEPPQTFKEYHEHILDRMLYQCFLKSSQQRILQETLIPILNDIILFGIVLDSYTQVDVTAEDKLGMKCDKIFTQFQTHIKIFVRVLTSLEDKGSGRLSNILNSTKFHHGFNLLYTRYEAKLGLDVFVKDLLVRLSLNGFYE